MKLILATIALALTTTSAAAGEQQTRFYDARGNSIGTAVPQSGGSVRYYDSRGVSLGTSTTTTRFYDSRGRSLGSTTGRR